MNNSKAIWGVLVVVSIIAIIGLKSPIQKAVTTLGSAAGFDFTSPFVSYDGLQHEYRSSAIRTATTTPCVFLSPSSTSTLTYSSLQVTVASSTATVWTLAKASNPYATTTEINRFTLASGLRGTMFSAATTTVGAADGSVNTIAPNTYVVWGLAGMSGSFDSTKLTGSCKAEFIVN